MRNSDERFTTLGCLILLVSSMAAAACLGTPSFEPCDDGACPAGLYCVIGRCQSNDCGNAIRDPGEGCDCGKEGVTPQDPSCGGRQNSESGGHCRLDCRLHCGDGEVAEDEVCDTAAPVTQSCTSLQYDFGGLACSASCDALITTDCGLWGWQPMEVPTGASLYGVWGSGPADVFAVGDGGTVLHYDGQSWESMASPTGDSLRGVWGSGPADVFAVGVGGTVLHYDGQSWESMASPTGASLNGVWGSGPADVLAVGVGGTVLHYDGQSWESMASPPAHR